MFKFLESIKVNIRVKLLLTFLVVVVLAVGIGVIAYVQLKTVQGTMADTVISFEIAESISHFKAVAMLLNDTVTEYALGDVYKSEELQAEYTILGEDLVAAHDAWMALEMKQSMKQESGEGNRADMNEVHASLMVYQDSAGVMLTARDELDSARDDYAEVVLAIRGARKQLMSVFWDQGYMELELGLRTMGFHEKEFIFQYRDDKHQQDLGKDIDSLQNAIAASLLPILSGLAWPGFLRS